MESISVESNFFSVSVLADAIASEILSFRSLPKGWCYGYGKPANDVSIVSSLQLLSLLRDLKYERIETFPDPDGSVLISAFCAEVSIEVSCRPTKLFDITVEKPGMPEENFNDVAEGSTFSKVRELSCTNQRKSYGYFTLDFTAWNVSDLRAQHLKTGMAGFQSLILPASRLPGEIFAPISQHSIRTQPGIPPFFGAFPNPNSPVGQSSSRPILTEEISATTTLLGSPMVTAVGGLNQNQWQISTYVPPMALAS
jgi:hypothetical protein